MGKYRVNAVKPSSTMKKYEHLRENGMAVPVGEVGYVTLKGEELDAHIERAIWDLKHPGQEPIREFVNGLPAE